MTALWIALAALCLLLLLILTTCYICFRMAFYAKPRKRLPNQGIQLPEGEIYEPFREVMTAWATELREMPYVSMTVTSFDGLRLCGKYYEYAPGAPIELMFHGYRGSAERDLCGGVQRCFALNRSALIVDQRCSGKSEGKAITFGINEHRDCLTWVDFMVSHFGEDVKIILTGISMGASTVLLASGKPLPPQVIGVLADCGYSSAKDIIKIVIREMGLPADLAYPFVKWGARLFGHFNLEETSPVEAVAHSTTPTIFFHGEADAFVPCEMSKINFNACAAKKRLVTVPGAGHGLSYVLTPDDYLNALEDFFENKT